MENLNPHSNLASFYRYFYRTGELPNNLCTYFWGLIFAFISLPFVWPIIVINWNSNKITYKKIPARYRHTLLNLDTIILEENKYVVAYNTPPTFVGFCINIIFFIVGMLGILFIEMIFPNSLKLLNYFFQNDLTKIIFLVFWGVIVVIILWSSTIVMIKLIDYTHFLFGNKFNFKIKNSFKFKKINTNPNFLILTWKWLVAFKEKNCPIITWDYKDNG